MKTTKLEHYKLTRYGMTYCIGVTTNGWKVETETDDFMHCVIKIN